ncbi:hypothetical protein ACGFZP_14285 [Kitasatospora sp. NPDC048239]|uniref:hypothetical protein n=1 Tax=Kitasatospora sp. NPDC048239 TaxID=3364046 RepID=UPI0037244904
MYLDPEYRRRVISELVEHGNRTVAPSLGFDLVPVLAHALRARAAEIRTGAVLLAVWVAFLLAPMLLPPVRPGSTPLQQLERSVAESLSVDHLPVSSFAFLFALVCLLSWYGKTPAQRDRALYPVTVAAPGSDLPRSSWTEAFAVLAGLAQLGYLFLALTALPSGHVDGVVFPVLLSIPVWVHRRVVARTIRHDLGRTTFPTRPRAELPASPRYRAVGAAIDHEQFSQLTVYDSAHPFLGAGKPYQPWSFALELKRARGAPESGPKPAPAPSAADQELTARAVLDLIVPRLEALRRSAADTSRDRLKDLEIEEFVYLPVGPRREDVLRDPASVAAHLQHAVNEGAERRRHFLRIRVGAWDEHVVLSVLIRVHTQGRLLVLEVVPHVLNPIRADYARLADAVAQGDHAGVAGAGRSAVSAAVAGPAAIRALLRLGGGRPFGSLGPAAGPAVSLRELAAAPTVSLFQELDISRYVKTIQERIIDGVRDSLRNEGYETGRFEQYIVQVHDGGVYIGAMSGGAVATGSGASARHSSSPRPRGTAGGGTT